MLQAVDMIQQIGLQVLLRRTKHKIVTAKIALHHKPEKAELLGLKVTNRHERFHMSHTACVHGIHNLHTLLHQMLVISWSEDHKFTLSNM
jgi:hypothetical protein